MLISALAEDEQIVFFICLDPYRTPPDFGERQYKSRRLEKTVWSSSLTFSQPLQDVQRLFLISPLVVLISALAALSLQEQIVVFEGLGGGRANRRFQVP